MSEELHESSQVVDVSIRGSVYRVACREGERRRITELACRLNSLVNNISGSTKNKVSDALLLLLAGLTLEDKVEELSQELERIKDELSEYRMRCEEGKNTNNAVKDVLHYCLARIRKLTAVLEDTPQK